MGSLTNSVRDAISASNPDLALAECWYWIRKLQARFFAGDYASALEASLRAQQLLLDIAVTIRNGGVSLLWCALPRGSLGFRGIRTRDSSISRRWPLTTDSSKSGPRLPGEFRKPRGAGRGGDRPDRRPRTRCQEALRTGHPFGTRKRLCPQRGARQRDRRAFLRSARFREDRAAYLRAARACYLRWGADGKVRQLEEFYPHLKEEKPVPAPQHDRGTHRTTRSGYRNQSLASSVRRDRSRKTDRHADAHSD